MYKRQGYDEWRGDLPARSTGSLISYETGVAVAYGLFNAQQRGTLIVDPGDKVYEGMVVGYSPAGEDITVNVCKTKHLSNTRASGSDDALRLVPVSKFSLEESLEFLKPDELDVYKRQVPACGSRMALKCLASVDLPHPFAPNTATYSPRFTRSERPSTARCRSSV